MRIHAPLRFMLAAGLLVAHVAAANDFPSKPVRIVTGGAGTFHDIVARLLAQALTERWKQPVVVENQAGAGLTIGTGMVAHARADGYTLGLTDRSALAVAPWIFRDVPYDVERDFVPITLVAMAPSIVVARRDFPANDLRETLRAAREKPGQLHFATAGPATASHVAGQLLRHLAGVDLVLVPYKGGAASVVALLAGEVDLSTGLAPAVLPQIRAGKLKAFAVTAPSRFAGAPDIPTALEAGLPGFESQFWLGLVAPRGTPAAIVAKIRESVAVVLDSPSMRAKLVDQGAEPSAGDSEAFARHIRAESAAMKRLVEATGMRVEN